jgi:alpha-glucosidase
MTNKDKSTARPWWLDEVLYQIYPRSFADTTGDGVGDIQGIIERLDYLEWLGIGGIWLNPVMPSPNADWGYDVSDYFDVHPELGTLDDLDRLVKSAGERGIRILLDIVPNHTSDQHKWFKDALTGRDARYRDYYVWADPGQSGGPPNNWMSVFGGNAWEWHEPTGQYYLHNFLDSQPDLDWWNENVRNEFDDILRFWFDRGIAGFRIDVAHALIKDRALRDNLPAREQDNERQRRLGQRQVYNMNRPEVHDILKRWRTICDSYDPQRILVGETFVYELTDWVKYYGSGTDELNLAFNFPFALGPLDPALTKEIVRASEDLLPRDAWPVWTVSNHDIGRGMTRMCHNDPDLGRVLMMLVLTMRGTPFVYYGDEIGMTDTHIGPDQIKDPVGMHTSSEGGRDGCRTPMQWNADRGAGFTDSGVEPWLPFGDYAAVNVDAQRGDPDSFLNFTRSLIQLRKVSEDLRAGAYEEMDSPDGTWAFRRGDDVIVALNLSDEIGTVKDIEGTVRASTAAGRIDEYAPGQIDLQPFQGVIVVQSSVEAS